MSHQVVLTKGDLLPVDALSRCVTLVGLDLQHAIKVREGRRVPTRLEEMLVVSGHTGAGVQDLWRSLVKCADACSTPVSGTSELATASRTVRIHVAAVR